MYEAREQYVTTEPWPLDSLRAAADTAHAVPRQGIVLADPSPSRPPSPRPEPASANSWLLLALLAVFCLVCLRFKNNSKYFRAMMRDLTEVRERQNLFDDTVRETSFRFMLNLLCAASGGTLMAMGATWAAGMRGAPGSVTLAVCGLMAALYCMAMPVAYAVVGRIFADAARATMWVKGFVAAQGLLGLLLFPTVLAGLFYPAHAVVVLSVALVCLIITKLMFLFKGYRIFFARGSSWMLFLYYLCGLEIVPLIITYAGALYLIFRLE